jgi:nitroreductase
MVERDIPEDDDQTHRIAASSRFLAEHLGEVPVHVIPCTVQPVREERAMWESLEYETDLWNMAASSIYGELWPAAWSFMLALRSRGLGSSLTMIHLGAEPEIADLLDIPEGVSQAGLIPVAYSRGQDFKRGARRPLEEVTFYDRWGQTVDDREQTAEEEV